MKKRGILVFISLFLLVSVFVSATSFAEEVETPIDNQNFDVGEVLPEDHVFTTMDKDGNIIEYDPSELETKTAQENRKVAMLRMNVMPLADAVNGVVNFKTKPNATYNTSYTEDGTNRAGYVNGYYGADGAFLGYNADRSKVKFMQAGVTGWVNASEVQILNYDNTAQVRSINFYRSEGGRLYHYGTNDITNTYYFMTTQVGLRQSYMQDNVIYYSYDGHYFYKTYAQMIADYKAEVRSHSINPSTPYYNYYQYLSYRSKTNFTAANLNAFLLSKPNSSTSKMKDLGSAFIQNQDTYGVNGALAYGVAANESAWGQSSIAKNNNNLFGHAAYDSDPSGSANAYSSPAYSVYYNAKVFISEGYLDTKDYAGRYYGAHLGDKASGINVKYASDPYWGEKAAAISWQLSNTYGANDVNKYKIGIKPKSSNLNVRKDPASNATALYQTGTAGDYPVIILGSATGDVVNGSNVWYKIQSDTTLNASRTALTQDKGNYDFNNYYGYIHSSYVDIVNGSTPTPPPSKPNGLGDVNGDGKISALDYVAIKNHILKIKALSGNQASAADVNKDGKISALDYVAVKNHILGISIIK